MTLSEVQELLECLGLPEGDWALHGSGPLLAHGLVEEVNDVDVVARGEAWRRATELAPLEHGEIDDVVRPLRGVEVFNGWLGDDARELLDSVELVSGLPCVRLEAVLEFKRRLGRPKDERHIALIEQFLAARLPGEGRA